MGEVSDGSVNHAIRSAVARVVSDLSEKVWSGPATFTRSSEGSGTLSAGDHEGDAIDHQGALIAGAPGSRYTSTVVVRADAVFVGVRFEELVTVSDGATVMFIGCVFSRRSMPLVSQGLTDNVHLSGCRFTQAAGSGDVVSGSVLNQTFMNCCSNKTSRPVGANVTTFGVTT